MQNDAMEAIAAAKIGDFELADRKIADAEESLIQASSCTNRHVDTRSTKEIICK